ncbi:hypothetical protein QFC21_004384 [Naganishia friedmannii]|uniref:Uncharacterized protein n=1 Tax=Naganishia friedmannii TaxID=89922 RepID=A0ACC2VI12_9TREE|nr:hypothetical protein QFC21_004384 [Naganishia friedmannii]
MMAKLRKPRRPSDSQHRPAQLTVRIPSNSSSTGWNGQQYTSTPEVAPLALDGLRDLPISQGDFRGSVIIDSLSKRFSVLRAKASPIRATFAQTSLTHDPHQHLTGIDDIRHRLAAQRAREHQRGTGRYIAPEEEVLVLDELVSSFDDEDEDGKYYSPITHPRSTTSPYSSDTVPRSSGSRTFGFGSSTGMKEADVLRRAHHHNQASATLAATAQRSVSDKSLASTSSFGVVGSSPSAGGVGKGKQKEQRRKSAMMLAGLPVETQERIVHALLEIEEDLRAEEQQQQYGQQEEETMMAPYHHQASETLLPSHDKPQHGSTQQIRQEKATTTPQKQQRPRHQRQNSSITRSPFTENLADIVMGRETSGSANHSRTGSAVSTRARETVGPPPPPPPLDFAASVTVSDNCNPTTASSRIPSSSAPRSGLEEAIFPGDSHNADSDPAEEVFPLGGLPPIPDPVTRQQHRRTPSASAAVIPRTSLETGYVPGSARPFVGASSSTPRKSGSPLETIGGKGKHGAVPSVEGGDGYGLQQQQQQQLPQLVRKTSTAVIPPNRPGPLTLKPLLMPGSATTTHGGAGLPSVSPVVATFADSAGRKGWTGQGPFMPAHAMPIPAAQGHTMDPSSLSVDYPAVQSGSPLDASFDIDGYYGHGRSPVEPGMQYGPPPDARDERNATDPLRLAPWLQRQGVPPHVLVEDRESRASFDTLRSTFSQTLEDLPSPDLWHLPDLVSQRETSRSITSSVDLFVAEGGEDEEKQELFDELQAMQVRLIEAAREVRRGLSAGTQGDGRGRRGVSPSLRARPSIRTRKPEPSMYADMGENVSQLVRALSPRQPSDSSFRTQASVNHALHSANLVSPVYVPVKAAAVKPNDYNDDVRGLASPFQEQHKSPDILASSEASPQTLQQSVVTPRQHAPGVFRDDNATSDLEARTRLAKALFDSDHTSSAAPISEQRTEPVTSAAISKLEKDANIRRDFEARIAQATAQLHQTPSIKIKRKPSMKGRHAMFIGEPTLIGASSDLKVMPLPNSSGQDVAAAQPVGPAGKHVRPQSSSAVHHDSNTTGTGTGGGGFKNFVAKIKRNASLAERKHSKTPGSSPRITQNAFQPMAPIITTANISEPVQTYRDDHAPNTMIEPPYSYGVSDPVQEALPSRKSVIRRTIIYSTVNDQHDDNAPLQGEPAVPSTSSPTRRPSTRRKPVRHLSGDTDIFRAEGLLDDSQSHSISQVLSSQRTAGPSQLQKSSADSLYDIYADAPEPDMAEDEEEIIYTGNGTSFDHHARAHRGQFRPVNPRAIEIREMSDGQTTWSVLDVDEPALHDPGPADRLQPTHMRSSSLASSLSSYGGDSSQGRRNGLTHAITEITLDRQATARPKTNIFYSHERDVAELIDDLTRNGFEGKFRIVSPLQEQFHSPQPDPHIADPQATSSGLVSVETKLHALMQRMWTATGSSVH